MDARIDPAALFGVRPGEAHVLRNAGAVVTDDMERSLAISQRKLGTNQVLVVAHTRCGMATFTDDEFAAELAAETGSRPQWPVHTFEDPGQSVRDGLARLRNSPFLQPGAVVAGYVYDVDTGGLTRID
jgi:carbonic anhydrase